jgi:membrane protein implicated in regulation of membrane protease activity
VTKYLLLAVAAVMLFAAVVYLYRARTVGTVLTAILLAVAVVIGWMVLQQTGSRQPGEEPHARQIPDQVRQP